MALEKKSLTWSWLAAELTAQGGERGHGCILLESLLEAPRQEVSMQCTWGALVPFSLWSWEPGAGCRGQKGVLLQIQWRISWSASTHSTPKGPKSKSYHLGAT